MQIGSRQTLWTESAPTGKTVLVFRVTDDQPKVKIRGGNLAPGSSTVTVDWGDGTREVLRQFIYVLHEYRRRGLFTVVISDDLASFSYTGTEPMFTDETRQMLVEMKSAGSKLTKLEMRAFNNCRSMRGRMVFPGVTTVEGYAFGSVCGVREMRFPALAELEQTAFYTGPTADTVYADRVTRISSDFFVYYGSRLVDLYIRGKTRAQIKAMTGFPFKANGNVRFHGSDGIVLGNGQFK